MIEHHKILTKMLRCAYLLAIGVFSLMLAPLSAEEPEEQDLVNPSTVRLTGNEKRPGYTINFNNVSIAEYLKFISKISDLNFVYNEEELNFTVTILSEEPTDLSNVLAALVQVLRIHGFQLLDDGQNLVIHKNGNVKQIATIVSQEHPFDKECAPAIITRLFKIRNANPSHLVMLLKSMLSADCVVEVSAETRHLIVTDFTANVDKVADLLLTLDAPQTPLEIESFTAKNSKAENLIMLATQIIMPISEGNPVIMVAQDNTNTIFLVSTPFLVDKTLAVLEDLDGTPLISKEKLLTGDNIFLYNLQFRPAEVVENALRQISENLEAQGYAPEGLLETIDNAKYIPETHSLLFTGEPATIKKIQELLASIDSSGKPPAGADNSEFFIYKPQFRTSQELANSLKEMATNLDTSGYIDQQLISTIRNMQVVSSTNSLLFTGDPQSIEELKGLLKSLDSPTASELEAQGEHFYIYKIQAATEEQIAKSLNNLADNLEESKYPDKDLIEAIDSMNWIKETNSLIFTGNAAALKKLSEILPTFDVPPEHSKTALDQVPASNEFFIYTPKFANGEDLLNSIDSLSENLRESGLANPALIRALDSAKWVPSSHSIVFTGDPSSLARIKELMATIDVREGGSGKSTVFIYNVKHVPIHTLEKALDNIAENLPNNDDVGEVIDSMKVAEDSRSIIFKGPVPAIDKLKELLTILDTSKHADLVKSEKTTYFIYKLKNISGETVIKDLQNIVTKLEDSNLDNTDLIDTIDSIEWIKSTNSLYVSGPPETLAKVKDLIEEFDSERTAAATSYYIYKPTNITAEEMQTQLSSLAEGLQNSGLANPDLLTTITTAKYVPANNSLVFTGTPQSIDSVKEIIATIESQGPFLQSYGQKTFFIYKTKFVPGQQLISNLKNIAKDLQNENTADDDLISAIDTARFIPETNSIIFTGKPGALEKIQGLLDKFDIEALAPQGPRITPEGYVVYQPKNLPGPELINILKDFQQHLLESGVTEPSLFDTINNLKYMEKTSSIIISGNEASVKKVEELLAKFDVPGKFGEEEAEINTIDDTSFLIYKVKYHQGAEIEDALKKIATDLIKVKDDKNKNESLAQAIKSVQWIQVTNSLIGTGTPQTLSKLKSLIESIDVPLAQVFIEILVVETDLTNALNFGLRWGTQGKYRNKLGYSTGAFPDYGTTEGGGNADPLADFNSNLSKITSSTTPTGSMVPFTTGFGLGVIGDLIYHKGKSYTALGSLVDALRQDGNSTIVLSQKVITQDNKPSVIFTGDNIPFTGSTVQNVGSNSTVFNANLEYKDIGVSLNLTPRVGDDGLITLTIDQEISENLSDGNQSSASTGNDDNTSGGQISNPNVFGISTSKTSMQTQATVPDQHFLVLSGMMRNQKEKNRSGIPCLGGLPIIGAAFQRTDNQTVKKNVIIFVKPVIIRDFEQYKELTNAQEDLYRSQCEAEDFDEALELVKTPDDE